MIPWKWRLALAAKACLLLALAAGFGWLAVASAQEPAWISAFVGGLVFGVLGLFLAWAAGLGFADALLGRSETERGAVALESRKSGLSVRLAGGKYAEFILFNPWEPLKPHARYTVTYGRYSRVIVERPVPE